MKKSIQKLKYKIILLFACFVMYTKHHTVFILQNKLLGNMLICYQYRPLKMLILFNYILIDYDFDRYMTGKRNYCGKNDFFILLIMLL